LHLTKFEADEHEHAVDVIDLARIEDWPRNQLVASDRADETRQTMIACGAFRKMAVISKDEWVEYRHAHLQAVRIFRRAGGIAMAKQCPRI
jgi:hypothetical protein